MKKIDFRRLFFHKRINLTKAIMSTQIANNNSNMGPQVKKNLPAKYMRYMSYTYWLATQLRNADAISADVFNELMKGQKLHATVDVQINHFASFDGDEKTVTKAMKKKFVKRLSQKRKKTKEKDPNEPEKKRGRKKKEKVNAETDEEKLIASIVATARGLNKNLNNLKKILFRKFPNHLLRLQRLVKKPQKSLKRLKNWLLRKLKRLLNWLPRKLRLLKS